MPRAMSLIVFNRKHRLLVYIDVNNSDLHSSSTSSFAYSKTSSQLHPKNATSPRCLRPRMGRHGFYIHSCGELRFTIHIPMDVDRCVGPAEVRLHIPEGLHTRAVQWPASCLFFGRQHCRELRIDGLQPFLRLEQNEYCNPNTNVVQCRGADIDLFRPEEYLGAGVPVGSYAVCIQDIERSLQSERLVFRGTIVLWNYFWQWYWSHRPDHHWRQLKHVPLLRR